MRLTKEREDKLATLWSRVESIQKQINEKRQSMCGLSCYCTGLRNKMESEIEELQGQWKAARVAFYEYKDEINKQ